VYAIVLSFALRISARLKVKATIRFSRLRIRRRSDGVKLDSTPRGEVANLSWKLRRSPGAEAILMEEKHGGDGEGERPPLRVWAI
jgi:hypothetical protein